MSADALVKARNEMFAAMMEAVAEPASGAAPLNVEDTRQFVAGFLDLAIHSAQGDDGPRDQYLSLIVPSIKQAGMPLGTVMAGMIQVALGGAQPLTGEASKWWLRFCSDYARRLSAAWETA